MLRDPEARVLDGRAHTHVLPVIQTVSHTQVLAASMPVVTIHTHEHVRVHTHVHTLSVPTCVSIHMVRACYLQQCSARRFKKVRFDVPLFHIKS